LSPGWPFSSDPVDALTVLPLDLGDGIVLHETTERDAVEAFTVISAERERLREWLPWVDGTIDVSVERDFLRSIEQANSLGLGFHATIRLEGEFCGCVGLRIDLMHRSAEVGYWLSALTLGRGVMIRSVAAIFDVGFDVLRMHRLELLAATRNTRSRSIADRLGMTFEGTRREAEELPTGFVDLAMYAVLAQDWPGATVALERAIANGA
jgi:ribosomal-protein-serine acetyltransferase